VRRWGRAARTCRGLCPHIAIPALSNTFWSASEAYRFRLIGYGSPHRGQKGASQAAQLEGGPCACAGGEEPLGHAAVRRTVNTFWSASEAYRFRLIGYGSPHRGMSERLFPTGARSRMLDAAAASSSAAAEERSQVGEHSDSLSFQRSGLTLLDPSSLILRSSGTTSCQNALLPGFAPQPQRILEKMARFSKLKTASEV
jgi:hypothetical protein